MESEWQRQDLSPEELIHSINFVLLFDACIQKVHDTINAEFKQKEGETTIFERIGQCGYFYETIMDVPCTFRVDYTLKIHEDARCSGQARSAPANAGSIPDSEAEKLNPDVAEASTPG
jgi:hypothetical protein